MSALVFVLRVGLGLTLIVAGALKVGHAPALAAAIATFRLLPPVVVAPIAVALPYLEILLGIYLSVGLFTRIAAIVVAVQFVIYAAAIASAVVRHIPANCGCFGPADSAPADWAHVVLDCSFAALGGFIALFAPGALALDRRIRPR